MADHSAIEWTDATWNPTVGCSIVSPGCTNCYAMKVANGLERRFGSPKYSGLTKVVNGNAVWTGEVRLDEAALLQPLKWKKPRRIFVNSMSDLFHEALPDEAIDKIFAVMALCARHSFQVLTKRAERMREYVLGWKPATLTERGRDWPLPNVWLGVSVERQQEADERIPLLLQTPAAVRFISAEPLLGAIDLTRICLLPQKPGSIRSGIHIDTLRGRYCESGVAYKGDWDIRGPVPPDSERRALNWVIVGGESGSRARPMEERWALDIRDQCAQAGVAFFFKQWGEHAPDQGTRRTLHKQMIRVGKKSAGRLLDGQTYDGMPGK